MKQDTSNQNYAVGSTKKTIAVGLLACALLVSGIGTWSATAKLSSAIVTSGQVMVASDVKVVQNPDGGVVSAINVKDGDVVKAGDVVMTLDDSLLNKSREAADNQLVALEAQLARLTAERDGAAELTPNADLQARIDSPAVQKALTTEAKVMATNKAARDGQVDSYRKQIAETKDKITGLETQRDAKTKSIDLLQDELVGVQKLYDDGYVPKTRIIDMKSQLAGLEGDRGALISQIAVAKGQIEEIGLNIAQVQKSFEKDTQSQIASDIPQIAGLTDRRDAADVNLSHVIVRAPSDGVVNQLEVHTVGEVIRPGQTLMQIVPQNDSLLVTARVPAKDITHVKVGQDAQVSISAFDRNATPRLTGKVSYVSADLAATGQQAGGQGGSGQEGGAQTGAASYEVRIALDNVAKDHPDLQFLPGMQAEVYISAGQKTVAQYLTEPVAKRLDHTFREI